MKLLLSSAIGLSCSAVALAQEPTVETVDDTVALFVEHVENEAKADAIALVEDIYLMGEDSKLVDTPEAFVNLVAGCEEKLVEARQLGGNPVYRLQWNCRSKLIEAWVAKDHGGEQLEVWDVVDGAMIAARADARPVRPQTLEEAGLIPTTKGNQ